VILSLALLASVITLACDRPGEGRPRFALMV